MDDKMITGQTDSGFAFTVPEAALDDWELLEAAMLLDEGNRTGYVTAAKQLLGDDGAKALKEHCRGENGRVKLSDMAKELNDIFAKLSKN